jgi:hypothetical protein
MTTPSREAQRDLEIEELEKEMERRPVPPSDTAVERVVYRQRESEHPDEQGNG